MNILGVGGPELLIILVLMFQNSSNLASAYGIAVTGAMFIDTLLIFQSLTPHAQHPLRRVVLFGNGGGTSVLATDYYARLGLDVLPFNRAAIDALADLKLPMTLDSSWKNSMLMRANSWGSRVWRSRSARSSRRTAGSRRRSSISCTKGAIRTPW